MASTEVLHRPPTVRDDTLTVCAIGVLAAPATAGAHSGLLWFRYYVPKGTTPATAADHIQWVYRWIIVAVTAALIYILVLGHGMTLTR